MPTYTVKWRDATYSEHTHAGVDTPTMLHYASVLSEVTINPVHQMTLISVTLDEPADAQLDDITLARVEDSINP
jgi:hypothetical protein